jgi:ribulose-phosphate 3-epimerase
MLRVREPGRAWFRFTSKPTPHAHRNLAAIRAAGGLAGIVINPATSLSALDEVIKFADYVLVMSVNPGFGGQEFIPESLDKVRRLRKMIDERRLNTRIEIDGGINVENIAEVTSAGAERLSSRAQPFLEQRPLSSASRHA